MLISKLKNSTPKLTCTGPGPTNTRDEVMVTGEFLGCTRTQVILDSSHHNNHQAPSVSPGVSPRFYCRLCKSLFVGLGTESNQGWTGSETVYGRRGPCLPPPVPLATLHSNRNCHRTLQWFFVAIPSFGQTMGNRQTKQNGYRTQKLLKSKCSPDQTLQVALKPESPERAGCRLLGGKGLSCWSWSYHHGPSHSNPTTNKPMAPDFYGVLPSNLALNY